MLQLYELTWRKRRGKGKPCKLTWREYRRKRKQKKRENEAKLDRLRRERSVGTSFDGLGGGNSSDRRGTAASTIGPMWTRGVSTTGGLRQSLPNFPRGIVPKFSVECSPSEYITWERRFKVFIADQGLRHTISPDAPEIAVISCTNNAYLFGQFGEDLVTNNRRVWGYISEATAGATFEDRLYECHSISDALRIMREWSLPLHPAERYLLVAELERVQFMGDEDPNFSSARTSYLETTMRAVGIEKDASEIVQFILRQFPERPSNPHALVVGRGFRDGRAVGVGVQRRDDHMVSSGGGMPRQQQQPLQHWPRDGGMPRQQQLQQHWPRDGGMPRQQQPQQLQYWSRDDGMLRQQQPQHRWSRGGGMPRQQQQQQQWSRGGGIPHQHQRRSHAFPPARQARQQQPLRQPSRIPTIGGDGEDGSSLLSETCFGGDGGAVQEWFPSETVEMPMFSLLEGPQQLPPTAAAAAPTAAAAAPAAEAMNGTRVFPDVLSEGVAEAPTSSAGAAPAAEPAAAPATGGTVFPTASVGGTARAPAPADETAASKAAPTTSGTVPSATPLRGAVGARESPAGAASTDTAAEAAPPTVDTTAPDASVERAAKKLPLE